GGPVEAARGEVAAVGSEHNLSDHVRMANARSPDRPGRHVHKADVIGVISPRAMPPCPRIRPEDRTHPARVELGKEVIVRALRLPCGFGGRERRPAVGAREPPEPPVAATPINPGYGEPPVRALFHPRTREPLPGRVVEAHPGRPGRPGSGVED